MASVTETKMSGLHSGFSYEQSCFLTGKSFQELVKANTQAEYPRPYAIARAEESGVARYYDGLTLVSNWKNQKNCHYTDPQTHNTLSKVEYFIIQNFQDPIEKWRSIGQWRNGGWYPKIFEYVKSTAIVQGPKKVKEVLDDRFQLTMNLINSDQKPDALFWATLTMKEFPKKSTGYVLKARYLLQTTDASDKSLQEINKILQIAKQLGSKDPQVYTTFAFLKEKEGNTAEAQKMALKARKLCNQPWYSFSLSGCCTRIIAACCCCFKHAHDD